jgi:hypothetical protein
MIGNSASEVCCGNGDGCAPIGSICCGDNISYCQPGNDCYKVAGSPDVCCTNQFCTAEVVGGTTSYLAGGGGGGGGGGGAGAATPTPTPTPSPSATSFPTSTTQPAAVFSTYTYTITWLVWNGIIDTPVYQNETDCRKVIFGLLLDV